MPAYFQDFASLCEKLEATTKRNLMIQLVASFILQLETEEIAPSTTMLLGRVFPRWDNWQLEVSWATLEKVICGIANISHQNLSEALGNTGDIGEAAKLVFAKGKIRKQATLLPKKLTILEVHNTFKAIAEASGTGSKQKKERLLGTLLSHGSPSEVKYIVKILIGEMRMGFHESLMELAVAEAFNIEPNLVQTATMLSGEIGKVATKASEEGREGLQKIKIRLFRPIKPMLASTAHTIADVFDDYDKEMAFEYKFDGARIQIHKLGQTVRIYSRRLTEVTSSLPEIVGLVKREIKAEDAVLEGEVVAVDKNGNPMLFQHLMRRFKRVHRVKHAAREFPVQLYLFDALYIDGQSLISEEYAERRKRLVEIAGTIHPSKQLVTRHTPAAERFLREAIEAGHEGLMAKKLDGSYTPGVRGKKWFKIKKTLEPLDLIIVAAEYGYGRRHGWLSDYYLAARDMETSKLWIVGKTFKGLTDSEIIEMTRKLKESAITKKGHLVTVAPKIVVEIAYNEIQKSSKYQCGMALRFARITKIRDDKSVEDVDTIQKVRDIYETQFKKKARTSQD